MALGDTLALCLGALAIEALWGYPRRLYALIDHPVTWIDRLIELADRRLNDPSGKSWTRRASIIPIWRICRTSASGAWSISAPR